MASIRNVQPSTATSELVGDSSFTSHLASSLSQLRTNGTLCDGTIVVDQQRFQAHRAVLSASSSSFMANFTQDSESAETTIHGTAESFAQLLQFAYTGYFHLSPETAFEVLKMAINMNVTSAIGLCREYLLSHVQCIPLENILEIVSNGDVQTDFSDLVKQSRLHLLRQFLKSFECKAFLDQVSFEFLLECLEDEDIETDQTTEEQILLGVLKWLKHRWDQRKIHAADLFKKIRLGLVPVDRLTKLFDDEILAIRECKEMLEEVLRLHATKESAPIPLNQSHPDMFATRKTVKIYSTANMASIRNDQPSTATSEPVGDSSFTSHLASSLSQLRNNSTLCDVTIVVDRQRFQAHRAVLSASSSYFMAMFTSGFQESESAEITINGTAESFAQLLQFAYTGYFHLSPATAFDVLKMASYTNVTSAIVVCREYLLSHVQSIPLENILEIVSNGDVQTDFSDVIKQSRLYLLRQFLKCFKRKAFLDQVSFEFLLECLEDENIETDQTTEEQILLGILNWLKHSWDQRKIHAADLFKKIRLGLVPVDRLTELFDDEILAIRDCQKMLEEVLRLHATKESAPIPLNQSHPDMFATRNTITALLAISEDVRYYDDTGKDAPTWKTLPKFPPPPDTGNYDYIEDMQCQTAVVKDQLHVAGLLHHNCSFGEVTRYNIETNDWVELESKVSQNCFTMVELDGYIYAMGGLVDLSPEYEDYEENSSKFVERYNIAADNWEDVCPLVEDIGDTTAVVFNGTILIAVIKEDPESSTEYLILQMYSPSSNLWHVVYKDMCQSGLEPVLTVQNNHCYLVLHTSVGPNSENNECHVKVYKLTCDFDMYPPHACLGEEVIQSIPPSSNSIGAFSISDELFVNVRNCVYKLKTKGDQSHFDLGVWSNIIPDTKVVACFTFDKRLYT